MAVLIIDEVTFGHRLKLPESLAVFLSGNTLIKILQN
jgi:hypothetical protein